MSGLATWFGQISHRVFGHAALALVLASPPSALAQSQTPSPVAAAEPVGRWIGAGIQVDWLGNPLEIPRVVVGLTVTGVGRSTILHSAARARSPAWAPPTTLLSTARPWPPGLTGAHPATTVSFRAAGDRWVYNWAVRGDWLKPDAMASQGLPAQPAAGPDGDWVRSGVLSSAPTPSRAFAPRNPAASVTERASHIENGMLPAVLVAGEPIHPVTLADRMAALRVPGVGVAVIHDGRIDWTRGYGLAGPNGKPVTTDTVFQAASISKPVTALVTMRLAQQKAIDLDIDVNAYLGGWKLPRDPNAADRLVTLRDLLTHTGGATGHGFAGYAPGAPIPTTDQILNGQPPANSDEVRVDTTPGALWRYSGGGYVCHP